MNGQVEEPRKALSCADFDKDALEHAARLAELKSMRIGAFNRKITIRNVVHKFYFYSFDYAYHPLFMFFFIEKLFQLKIHIC